MASKAHDFIVIMIAFKIKEMGYTIISSDGDIGKINMNKLRSTPTLKRHKPDLIAIHNQNGRICIGEAKTDSDLQSNRTRHQFEDFASLFFSTGDKAELVIGIPFYSYEKLKKLLRDIDILNKDNVHILRVPEGILPK